MVSQLSSESGYSADREEQSISPPLVSIDLLGVGRENVPRDTSPCPKRRKRNELEYAVSSVKADLARAGIELPEIEKEMQTTALVGDASINLKGVRLMHSSDFETPFVTSNVSSQTSIFDYEQLSKACWGYYPNDLSQLTHNKVSLTSAQEDSDRSISSVSGSESDSGDSNGNTGNQAVLFIPPLLDDSCAPDTQARPISTITGSCNIISCATNAVTMSEVLQLSKVARLIANSCAPFSIVHANAAFFRLSGLAPDQILGARFSSILESEPNSKHTSLPECMMSSSSGNHKKLVLRAEYPQEATKSRVKVSPIVARKTTSSEATTMTTMTHYVIEFNFDGETPERNIRRPVADSHLAVGVMG